MKFPMTIAERPVGQRGEMLRVYLDAYKGRHSLHVRRFYLGDDGELRPGKGAAVPAHLIPLVRQAVVQAEQHALEHSLLDEEAYESIGEPIPAKLLGEAA